MEDRRLTADAVCVNLGAGIHIRSAVKKNPAGVHETVFGGDVEKSTATNSHQTAVSFRESCVTCRRRPVKRVE